MPHWIYSHESLPNQKLMGKPGYTPDSEFIRWGGLTLPPLPERQWTKLPEYLNTIRRSDWRDRQGTPIEIHISKFGPIIKNSFAKRGVIFMDHEPNEREKEELQRVSKELNLEWRKECIQMYEDQVREKETTGHGRTKPTPYEDECYEILGQKKPYSVEHFQAMRNPGDMAAQKIAAAIADSQRDLVTTLVDALTKPASAPATK